MSVQEIEKAAKELPTDELDGLLNRLFDFFHDRWDKQIKGDVEAGRLDALLNEAREDIRQGRTKPL
ncbi:MULTISPECIES: hypothetical protein [unclassified Spirosoma]|uniref:hypothetical protein n=1 Tax=unclassified Spirosoma TaxID=2621999 RepID=UPI000A48A793|nr:MULTISPECIES: hypothetical protein [unclassified Spirosoma]MBN8825230.1 hypothetical protein [Spirosoma sp.]